jgi:hypothetical protein
MTNPWRSLPQAAFAQWIVLSFSARMKATIERFSRRDGLKRPGAFAPSRVRRALAGSAERHVTAAAVGYRLPSPRGIVEKAWVTPSQRRWDAGIDTLIGRTPWSCSSFATA